MSESLIVIRTFGDLLSADEAQMELLSAGIYSLIYTDEGADVASARVNGHGIGLAVHRRDADIAEAVLTARPDPS